MAEFSTTKRPVWRPGLGHALVLGVGVAIGFLLSNLGKPDQPVQPQPRAVEQELVETDVPLPQQPPPRADGSPVPTGRRDQVLLRVRMLEVALGSLPSLGLDLDELADGAIPSSRLDASFDSRLDALQKQNKAKVLAEPTLVTVSGRKASFNVGGEFPVYTPKEDGTTSISLQEYGTRVDLLPTRIGEGRYRVAIAPRVTQIDTTPSGKTDEPPGLDIRTRAANAEVDMSSGESVVFGATTDTSEDSNADRKIIFVATLERVAAMIPD